MGSTTQVYAMLKRIQRIEDSNSRTNNKVNSVSELLETELPAIRDQQNQSNQKLSTSEDRRVTNERIAWIAVIFVILIVGFTLLWRKYSQYRYKKYLMGAG